MIPNTSYSGPLWMVAYVEPRAEMDVARDLDQELGFDWCVPLERVRRNGDAISRPMLSRYVLFGCDPYRQAWQAVLDLDGVIDVLMSGHDIPGYVPASWVHAMRKAEAVGAFDYVNKHPGMFKISEIVRIGEGPFAGLNATIVEFIAKMRSSTARKRARVLFNFMGRMTDLELPVTALEKL